MKFKSKLADAMPINRSDVMNLATGEVMSYILPPRKAVVCAYAQSKADYSTWQYDERYDADIEEGELTLTLGDWSVFKDGRRLNNAC